MLIAFLWGLLATSSLVWGGLIASYVSISKRTVGIIMAMGAGALISAVSFELVFASLHLGKFTGFPGIGFLAGATGFYLSEYLIRQYRADNLANSDRSTLASRRIAVVLAVIIDSVPEPIVIGLELFHDGSVSPAMVAAVFIASLSKSMATPDAMKTDGDGRDRNRIVLFWCFIALVCAGATGGGYGLFHTASARWMSFIYAFAGGMILMKLAISMMPEAYAYGGRLSGVFTILGYYTSVTLILLEQS